MRRRRQDGPGTDGDTTVVDLDDIYGAEAGDTTAVDLDDLFEEETPAPAPAPPEPELSLAPVVASRLGRPARPAAPRSARPRPVQPLAAVPEVPVIDPRPALRAANRVLSTDLAPSIRRGARAAREGAETVGTGVMRAARATADLLGTEVSPATRALQGAPPPGVTRGELRATASSIADALSDDLAPSIRRGVARAGEVMSADLTTKELLPARVHAAFRDPDAGFTTEFVANPRRRPVVDAGPPADAPPSRLDRMLGAASVSPGGARPANAPTAVPSGETADEPLPGEVGYRDPMGIAQVRADAQRIADGRLTRNPVTGAPYTDDDRRFARYVDKNLRARQEREEAKGGTARRTGDVLARGLVNYEGEIELRAARASGDLVTAADLDLLGLSADRGRLRTDPTFGETAKEEFLPEALGILPYLVVPGSGIAMKEAGMALGPGSALGRAFLRAGNVRGGPAPSRLGQVAQRGLAGGVPASGVGGEMAFTREIAAGGTPGEAARRGAEATVANFLLGGLIQSTGGATFDVLRGPLSRIAGAVTRGVDTHFEGIARTNLHLDMEQSRAAEMRSILAADAVDDPALAQGTRRALSAADAARDAEGKLPSSDKTPDGQALDVVGVARRIAERTRRLVNPDEIDRIARFRGITREQVLAEKEQFEENMPSTGPGALKGYSRADNMKKFREEEEAALPPEEREARAAQRRAERYGEDVPPAAAAAATGDTYTAYHGTQGVFDNLQPSTQGQFGPAIYLTGDPAEASRFAVASSSVGNAPNVRIENVTLRNPLRLRATNLDKPPREWFPDYGPQTAENVERWKAQGYDGVIAEQPEFVRDADGNLVMDAEGKPVLGEWKTHYVAFSPEQVRSPYEPAPPAATRTARVDASQQMAVEDKAIASEEAIALEQQSALQTEPAPVLSEPRATAPEPAAVADEVVELDEVYRSEDGGDLTPEEKAEFDADEAELEAEYQRQQGKRQEPVAVQVNDEIGNHFDTRVEADPDPDGRQFYVSKVRLDDGRVFEVHHQGYGDDQWEDWFVGVEVPPAKPKAPPKAKQAKEPSPWDKIKDEAKARSDELATRDERRMKEAQELQDQMRAAAVLERRLAEPEPEPELGRDMFGEPIQPKGVKQEALFGEGAGTQAARDDATLLANKDRPISAEEMAARRDELGAKKKPGEKKSFLELLNDEIDLDATAEREALQTEGQGPYAIPRDQRQADLMVREQPGFAKEVFAYARDAAGRIRAKLDRVHTDGLVEELANLFQGISDDMGQTGAVTIGAQDAWVPWSGMKGAGRNASGRIKQRKAAVDRIEAELKRRGLTDDAIDEQISRRMTGERPAEAAEDTSFDFGEAGTPETQVQVPERPAAEASTRFAMGERPFTKAVPAEQAARLGVTVERKGRSVTLSGSREALGKLYDELFNTSTYFPDAETRYAADQIRAQLRVFAPAPQPTVKLTSAVLRTLGLDDPVMQRELGVTVVRKAGSSEVSGPRKSLESLAGTLRLLASEQTNASQARASRWAADHIDDILNKPGEVPTSGTGSGTLYANPLGPVFRYMAKNPAAARNTVIAAIGTQLAGLDEDRHPYLHETGLPMIGLAALSMIGSKNMGKAGSAVTQAIVGGLRQTTTGKRVVNFLNPDALLSRETMAAVRAFERMRAQGAARAVEVSAKPARLGPELDRAVSDVVEGEDWENLAKFTPEQMQQALTIAAELVQEFTALGQQLVKEGVLTQGQYDAYAGRYLPRRYAEWDALRVMGETQQTAVGGKKSRITDQKSRTLDEPVREINARLREAKLRTSELPTEIKDAEDEFRRITKAKAAAKDDRKKYDRLVLQQARARAVRDALKAEAERHVETIATYADDITEAELLALQKRLTLGEIREASYRTSVGIEKGYRDLAAAKLFGALRSQPGVIHPEYLTKLDAFLAARQAYYQAQGAGKAQALQALDQARYEMVAVADKFKAAGTDSDYVVLPDSKSLGVLRGMVVTREVANSVNGLPDLRATRPILHWWKKAKTVFNPGTHIANFVSNMNMVHVAGIPLWEQPRFWARSMRALGDYNTGRNTKQAEAARALAEAGVLNVNVVTASSEGATGRRAAGLEGLQKIKGTTRPETRDVLEYRNIPDPTSNRFVQWVVDRDEQASRLYNQGDNLFRVALYLKATDPTAQGGMGMTSEQGVEFALKSMGDFRSRSPALHLIRGTVAPFILYPAKALPAFTANVIDHPHRYLTLVALWAGMNEASREEVGAIPQRDLARRDRVGSAGYMLPGFTQLPFESSRGEKMGLDVSRWTPYSGLTTAAPPGTVGGQLSDDYPAMLTASGPLPDVIGKFVLNVDPFTGKKIVSDTYTPAENIGKIAKNAAMTMLPSAAGFHAPRLAEDIENRDWSAAGIDMLGPVGLRPRMVRPGMQARQDRYRFEDQKREIKRDLSQGVRKSKNPAKNRELIQQAIKRRVHITRLLMKRLDLEPR